MPLTLSSVRPLPASVYTGRGRGPLRDSPGAPCSPGTVQRVRIWSCRPLSFACELLSPLLHGAWYHQGRWRGQNNLESGNWGSGHDPTVHSTSNIKHIPVPLGASHICKMGITMLAGQYGKGFVNKALHFTTVVSLRRR